jgi:hypothetical protein
VATQLVLLLIKLLHSKQVAAGEAPYTRLRSSNELSKPVNHSVDPFRSFDLAADRRPYLPVEVNKCSVDGLNDLATILQGYDAGSLISMTEKSNSY